MKRILLTPYPGYVMVTPSRGEFAKMYKRITGEDGGRFSKSASGRVQPFHREGFATVYLVYYGGTSSLVHELSHVALMVFDSIGSDPSAGKGEPFCYLLGHLYSEAMAK